MAQAKKDWMWKVYTVAGMAVFGAVMFAFLHATGLMKWSYERELFFSPWVYGVFAGVVMGLIAVVEMLDSKSKLLRCVVPAAAGIAIGLFVWGFILLQGWIIDQSTLFNAVAGFLIFGSLTAGATYFHKD